MINGIWATVFVSSLAITVPIFAAPPAKIVIDHLPEENLVFVTGKHFGSSGTITTVGCEITPFEGIGPEYIYGNRIIFSTISNGKNTLFLRNLNDDSTSAINVNDQDADYSSISSVTGNLIFVAWSAGRKTSHIVIDNGAEFIALTGGEHRDSFPHWSPDGKQIVFESDRDGVCQIYVMDADGKNQTNLSNDNIPSSIPKWSPDGKQIAYVSIGESKTKNIFTMNKDGSQKRNISQSRTRDSDPTWSPSGKWIAFTRTVNNLPGTKNTHIWTMDIWLMKSDGAEQQQVTQNNVNISSYDPCWYAKNGQD